MTRDNIVDQIANRLKRPNDLQLKSILRDMVVQQMNNLLRRSIHKNGIDNSLILPFYSPLVTVNPFTHKLATGNNVVSATKLRIPTPLRFNTDTPYIKVTDENNVVYPFKPVYRNTKSYRSSLPFVDDVSEYSQVNSRLIFDRVLTVSEIIVYQVYAEPDLAIENYYGRLGYAFDEDMAFPYPTDLIEDITNLIVKGELSIPAEQ